MIWVAWRQHRAGVLTALGIVAAFAAVMLFMRWGIESTLSGMGEGGCLSEPSGCDDEVVIRLLEDYGFYTTLAPLVLYLLPVLLGIVAGAPVFAGELSQGSHLFSLTQSTSRKRWWAVKLGVTLVPIAVAVGLLGVFSKWALGSMLNGFFGPLAPGTFEVQGPVMAGYLVLAFSLAATLGLLTRNNVVPMVITVFVYIAVAASTVLLVRPAYLPVEAATASVGKNFTINEDPAVPGQSWHVGEVYVDKDGKKYDDYADWCNMDSCKDDEIVSYSVEYHPATRFWAFQGIEAGVYLVLGAAVLAVGARRLRALP